MFQNNPLLVQLKQQLYFQTLRAEGVVKATEKGFGFLEVDTQKRYFIPPAQMKKVMHGDRITAVIHTEKERESAEPEILIEPFLTRFVGTIHKKDKCLSIIPDHPLLKDAIFCRAAHGSAHNFQEGDWAVAEMRHHPLKGNHGFYAELTQFITYGDDHFLPWLATLARHNLEKEAPDEMKIEMLDEGLERRDLTALNFITIDNKSTQDIDDALYVEEDYNDKLRLTVAIADPTAWIAEGSQVDESAKVRAFTNYLPNFNIPMLPLKLSNDLCSLRPHEARPALACRMVITSDGTIADDVEFFAATIESKGKLAYGDVSDRLENTGNGSWQPENESIATQIHLLHRLSLRRCKWRASHALVLKNRPDYRFVLNEKDEVLDIVIEPRRTANHIVEETMIAANICAAHILRDKLGFGIYNVHTGFDPANTEALIALLKAYDIHVNPKEILTLDGFCKLRRILNVQSSGFLERLIHRFQSLSMISTKPGPHFGLGLDAYATWTSPIRKYGDMLNHRMLKAIMKGETISRPREAIVVQMAERRRLNRMAERDVGNWLYARFLHDKAGTHIRFTAEIIEVHRSGIRVRLIDNGAIAYIPGLFLHAVRNELVCNKETGFVHIKGKAVYKLTDLLDVNIAEVRMETRTIIARPAAITF